MHKRVLAPDRVLLLLSLVPYLREHGPAPVSELARVFGVDAELLRTLVRFLGAAGVPGETLSYQHEDLFDIDWDEFEQHDVVTLTNTVAVDDAPRFAPAETAALVAGLEVLAGMLPPEDAELARRTATKLGSSLGREAPVLSVAADPHDRRLPEIVAAIDSRSAMSFDYRDGAGRVSSRRVDPLTLTQRDGVWYLRAYCHDRRAERDFRLDRLTRLHTIGAETETSETPGHTASPRQIGGAEHDGVGEQGFALVASLPAHLLPRIRGFAPEPIEQTSDGWVRVRIEAWYEATAIRLVQTLPADLTIEAPKTARETVRAWAGRALARDDVATRLQDAAAHSTAEIHCAGG